MPRLHDVSQVQYSTMVPRSYAKMFPGIKRRCPILSRLYFQRMRWRTRQLLLRDHLLRLHGSLSRSSYFRRTEKSVKPGLKLEAKMDRMCSCFISVVVLCTVLFYYTCICTCCYPSSLISERELHWGLGGAYYWVNLNARTHFCWKGGVLWRDIMRLWRVYATGLMLWIKVEYGLYKTRFGSLVVVRSPHWRRTRVRFLMRSFLDTSFIA